MSCGGESGGDETDSDDEDFIERMAQGQIAEKSGETRYARR
jgi:hypothetical protein